MYGLLFDRLQWQCPGSVLCQVVGHRRGQEGKERPTGNGSEKAIRLGTGKTGNALHNLSLCYGLAVTESCSLQQTCNMSFQKNDTCFCHIWIDMYVQSLWTLVFLGFFFCLFQLISHHNNLFKQGIVKYSNKLQDVFFIIDSHNTSLSWILCTYWKLKLKWH